MTGELVTIMIDDKEVKTPKGSTILVAAGAAGIYVPRLCYHPDLPPGGHCRVCTVRVNGKHTNACTQTVADGMVIENDTPELEEKRRNIIAMLFVEGNHFCAFCEASGRCELQALGYRFELFAPRYPYLYPGKTLDASHPEVFLDRNRCILCGRCIRASTLLDGKGVFGFEGRGIGKRIAVDSERGLGRTSMADSDRAAAICPTGSLVIKHKGYDVPVGRRRFDHRPIGAEIEGRPAGEVEGGR